METNLPVYRTVNIDAPWEMEEAHKLGYEILHIFYRPCARTEMVKEVRPVHYTVTWSSANGSMPNNNYYNNGYNTPQMETIQKEVVVVEQIPYALMKLGKTAELLRAKPE